MPVDKKHLGRRYGPYRFQGSVEHIKDFVAATAGGVPGHVFSSAPDRYHHPWTWDEEAALASPHGGVIAPPTFATTVAIEPFARACVDPELAVHGEQEFEFHEPVRPGDLLETEGEITRLQERGNLDFVEVTTTTRNQHGRMVVKGVWTAIIRN